MTLIRALSKFLYKAYLFFFCIDCYGLLNSIKIIFFVGSTSFKRRITLKNSHGAKIPFTFRGKQDLGVLSHFLKPGYFLRTLGDYKIKTILDCGANIGDETARFAYHHPEAEIIAVEADPDNYRILKENFSTCKNIHCIHGAVWGTDKNVFVFKSKSQNPESSFVSNSSSGLQISAYAVPTLMNLHKWEKINVLKMDIEGAEYEVFSHDTSWLKFVDCLIFEVPDSDRPGSLQLIFERLSFLKWNGAAIGENLILIRAGVPITVQSVFGISR